MFTSVFKQCICYDKLVLFAKIDKYFPWFVVATMDIFMFTDNTLFLKVKIFNFAVEVAVDKQNISV